VNFRTTLLRDAPERVLVALAITALIILFFALLKRLWKRMKKR